MMNMNEDANDNTNIDTTNIDSITKREKNDEY